MATAAAWLSDVDDGNSAAQQRVDAAVMSDCGDDRPSVGSSPEQTESASPEQTQHKPPQLPKVDYTKGFIEMMITCRIFVAALSNVENNRSIVASRGEQRCVYRVAQKVSHYRES